MNLRRPLIILVYALPVLVVAFGVLMGSCALSQATGDQVGATLCRRIAAVCLMLLVCNIVLLVGVLGVYVLGRSDQTGRDESDHRDSLS